MTFDAKIKLQAGFPGIYMAFFSLVALGIPLFLVFKSYQAMLDWVWTGLISVFAIVVLLRIYQQQAKQSLYSLCLEGNQNLSLIKARSGDSKHLKVINSSFTLQTSKLIFASLELEGGTKQNFVFHGLLNHGDAFRRFKAHLKWPQTRSQSQMR